MIRSAGLAVLFSLPFMTSAVRAKDAAPVGQAAERLNNESLDRALRSGALGGGHLAAAAPLSLAGVRALVGQTLDKLDRAPLVCGGLRPDGTKACRVARRYGAHVIDAPAPLTTKVRLRRLTLIVREQTIEAVALETSPDDFHAVVHLLKARLGPPARTQSDRVRLSGKILPRVTMAWRAQGVQVSLTDPTPFQTLSVLIGRHGRGLETVNEA